MNKIIFIIIICFVTICMKYVHLTNAQESNAFPLVNFNDFPPSIGKTAQKTYVTTVGLVPTSVSSVFDEAAFINSAKEYYAVGAGLRGYINLENVITQHSKDLLLVTYQVRYDYSSLTSDSAVDDSRIKKTIGDYTHVRAGIETGGSFTKQHVWIQTSDEGTNIVWVSNDFTGSGNEIAGGYVFETPGDNFQFTGKSLCTEPDFVSCNASHVTCIETIAGVSISCTSPCKLEYCKINGICKQNDPNSIPLCMCSSTYSVWYVGEYCQTRLNLWMLILAVVILCLLVVLTCLFAVCCLLARRTKTKDLNHKNRSHDKQATELSTFSYQAYNHSIGDNIPKAAKITQATPADSRHTVRRHPSRDSISKRDLKKHRRRHKSKASVSKFKTNTQKKVVRRLHSRKVPKVEDQIHHHDRLDSAFSNASDDGLVFVIGAPSVPVPLPRTKKVNRRVKRTQNDSVGLEMKQTSPIRWLPVQETSSKSNDNNKLSKNKQHSTVESHVFAYNQADIMV